MDQTHEDVPQETPPPVGPDTTGLGGLGWKPKNVKLVSLVLDNFKSFQRKTSIPFGRGFTAISGPNGSGKSNLIDAILFVLGFSRAKGLRADRLTDLICSEGGKPSARVALEFEAEDEQGRLRSFEVARVVRRTRTGQDSHYEVDGRALRLTDLHDLLRDLGLSSSGWNVVLQGDVTQFTLMGPVPRRKILDDQAGVAEFDARIAAAGDELVQADAHVAETRIILEEIVKRLVGLAKEREAALAYQALRDARGKLEHELAVLDVVEAERVAQRKADEAQARAEGLEGSVVELHELEAERDRLKAELDVLEAEIRTKGEGQKLEAIREVERLRAAVANATKRAAEARAEREGVLAGGDERARALAAAEEQARAATATADDVRARLEAKDSELAKAHEEHDALSQELSKRFAEQADALVAQRGVGQDLDGAHASERELSAREREAAAALAGAAAERTAAAKALSEARSRQKDLAREEAEAISQMRTARDEVATEEKRQIALGSRLQGLLAGIDDVEAALAQSERTLHLAEGQRRAVHDMGGGRALAAIREEGLGGVHGIVRELVKFEPRFALAIEAAAGARLSWIVVNDEHVAKRAIEILKRAGAGRAKFAPLTQISRARIDRRFPSDKGIVGLALDLCEHDERYGAIVENVLTDTLVVENIEVALPYLKRYRMVTLDGDVLERIGLIEGGEQTRGGSALAAAAKVEQEIAARERQVSELRLKRDAARKETASVRAELDRAREAAGAPRARLAQAQAKLGALQQEIERLATTLAEGDERDRTLAARLRDLDAQVHSVEAERASVLARIADLEARRSGLAPAEDPETEARNEALKERDLATRALEDGLAALRQERERLLLEQQAALARVEGARKAIAEAAARAEALVAEAERLDAEAATLSRELAAKDAVVAALMAELEALSRKRDEARAVAEEARDAAKDAEKSLEKEREEAARCAEEAARLAAVAKQARADAEAKGIALPATGEGLPSGEDGERPDTGKARAALVREIDRTDVKMKALEPVNMLAIAQFDESSARKAELDEKLAALDREKEVIRARMVELEGAKKTAFMVAFEAVSKAFTDAFAELAKGEGKLRLELPDRPFEGGLYIEARPRGKRVLLDQAMSGGEKSLTALAFLFALQSVNPAPFYVLDEVDMNLDGANTDLLAEAIRRRAETYQYLVVSHHRALLERAARALGATMRKGFGTQITGIPLREAEGAEAALAASEPGGAS